MFTVHVSHTFCEISNYEAKLNLIVLFNFILKNCVICRKTQFNLNCRKNVQKVSKTNKKRTLQIE